MTVAVTSGRAGDADSPTSVAGPAFPPAPRIGNRPTDQHTPPADEPEPVSRTASPLPGWQLLDSLTLAALPNAVRCAQLLVQRALLDTALDESAVRSAERAVAELVAHAVATTGVSVAVPIYDTAFAELSLLTVRLYGTAEQFGIEVWDCGTTAPHRALAEAAVIQSTSAWGYDHPAPDQRVVWCLLPLVTPPASTATLPSGVERRDPTLLQRVIDGLHRLDDPAEDR